MAKETFTGPILVLGALAGGQSGTQPREYSDEIGPSVMWAGSAIAASSSIASKDKTGPGTIPCAYNAFPSRTVNCPIQAGGATATISAAANAVAGTPLGLVAANAPGRSLCPIINPATGQSVTGVALDLGVDTGTAATAGTVTLNNTTSPFANVWRYNRQGMWVSLLYTSGSTVAFFTQVQSVNAATGVITVSPAPPVAGACQIGFTNRFNPNLYGNPPPSTVSSEAAAGSARISIPEVGNTRGVGILGVTGGPAGIPFLIQGIDGYGSWQSEIITSTAGATVAYGKKTYDIFVSATPQASGGAFNFQAVTSDLIGLPVSVMSNNALYSVSLGGTALAIATGYTLQPADLTNPATTTTGDVRGAIQLTANGPLAAPSAPGTLNGTNVLVVFQILDPLQVALATGINPGALLGVPPA